MKILTPVHLLAYMRFCLPFLLATLFYAKLFAQNGERSATVTNTAYSLPKVELPKATSTYALIVGVSKYKEVSSLRYADRDAQSFADFLKSKAGGDRKSVV